VENSSEGSVEIVLVLGSYDEKQGREPAEAGLEIEKLGIRQVNERSHWLAARGTVVSNQHEERAQVVRTRKRLITRSNVGGGGSRTFRAEQLWLFL